MVLSLIDFKNKVSECRNIEAGIWKYLNQDPINHDNILNDHGQLGRFITELSSELMLMSKEHEMFKHINTDSGKTITKLIEELVLLIKGQYTDLKNISNTQDKDAISIILDRGKELGQHESGVSQKIRDIETALINILGTVNISSQDTFSNLPKSEDIENKEGNYYFDDSLKRLRNAGYKRHLRPVEYFEIIKLTKDNPSSHYRKIFDNIFSSYGEWLSIAIKLENGQLYVALDPENIAWNKNHYELVGTDIKCSSLKTYSANNLKPGWNENISEFINIFGEGCKGIHLRDDNLWWPVGIGGNFASDSLLYLNTYGNLRASRGVK